MSETSFGGITRKNNHKVHELQKKVSLQRKGRDKFDLGWVSQASICADQSAP